MSSKTPFADAFEVEDGDVIKQISGKLIKLYDPETKPSTMGEGTFTVQNGVLEVEDIGAIRISITTQTLPKIAWNKLITVRSGRDKNKKLSGISYAPYTNKKTGETVEQLKINAHAYIEYPGKDDEEKRDTGDSGAKERHSTVGTVGSSRTTNQTGYTFPQLVEASVLSHREIDILVRGTYKNIEDEETLRCYVNAIFIEVSKNNGTMLSANLLESKKPKDGEDEIPFDWEGDTPKKEAPPPKRKKLDYAGIEIEKGPHAGKKLPEVPKDYLKKVADKIILKSPDDDTDREMGILQFCVDVGIITQEDLDDRLPF